MSAIRILDAGYYLTEEARHTVLRQADWIGECVQHPSALYFGFVRESERYVLVRDPSGEVAFLRPRFDLANKSPTGFAWGYGGSGPAQLALALCCDATGNDQMGLRVYQRFKFRWVSVWEEDRDWLVSREWVQGEVLAIAALLKVDEMDEDLEGREEKE